MCTKNNIGHWEEFLVASVIENNDMSMKVFLRSGREDRKVCSDRGGTNGIQCITDNKDIWEKHTFTLL